MLYSLRVFNPFNHTVLYEADHVCLSELVRGANRQIESKLDAEQLEDLRSFKKVKSKSKSRDDVLNITTVSKLLNRPKECSLFYRMLVQCSCSTLQPPRQ